MVTNPRNLRTAQSIWKPPRERALPHDPLTADLKADVLVIGAGITGAMIADALSVAGRQVVVVDKRGLAKGSTAASTALVQYEIDTPLTRLARKIGKSAAVRAWRRSRLAVDELAARLCELKPNAAVARPTLLLEGTELDAKGLLREQAAHQVAGLVSMFLDRPAVRSRFGISGRAALLAHGDFVLNPRATTLTFLRAATERRARIFAPVDIAAIESRRTAVVAVSRRSHHRRPSRLRNRLRGPKEPTSNRA
jgi:glycine/D-amino acid oxidase-like deaminating enzyme